MPQPSLAIEERSALQPLVAEALRLSREAGFPLSSMRLLVAGSAYRSRLQADFAQVQPESGPVIQTWPELLAEISPEQRLPDSTGLLRLYDCLKAQPALAAFFASFRQGREIARSLYEVSRQLLAQGHSVEAYLHQLAGRQTELVAMADAYGAFHESYRAAGLLRPEEWLRQPEGFLTEEANLSGIQAVLCEASDLLPSPVLAFLRERVFLKALEGSKTSSAGLLAAQWLTPQAVGPQPPQDQADFSRQVRFGFFHEAHDEAEAIAREIGGQRDAQALNYGDIAIILRGERFLPLLAEILESRSLPYAINYQSQALRQEKRRLYHGLQAVVSAIRLSQAADPQVIHNREWVVEDYQRHLSAWLSGQAEGMEGLPLLYELSSASAGLHDALKALISAYHAWQQTQSALNVLEVLLPAARLSGQAARQLIEAVDAVERTYRPLAGSPLALEHLLLIWDDLWPALTDASGEAVQILTTAEAAGGTFPIVMLPFMTADELHEPADAAWFSPERLKLETAPDDLNLRHWREERLQVEARRLADCLRQASFQVLLTTHHHESGSPVLPSDFYRHLLKAADALFPVGDEAAGPTPSLCFCHAEELSLIGSEARWVSLTSALVPKPVRNELSRFQGNTAWAALKRQPEQPLFASSDPLRLNPTAIQQYMQCPRQYYYSGLLKLRGDASDTASMGLLVHRLMEVFNRRFGQQPYTAEQLKTLADQLFQAVEPESGEGVAPPFREEDIARVSELDALAREEMRQRILAAIDDMAAKGYFNQPIKAIHPEQRLGPMPIDGLAGCEFVGVLDALIEREDGTFDIVDYKFYGPNRYSSKPETCEKQLKNVLEPLNLDADTHDARFNLSSARPREYQLPLYYLLTQALPHLNGRIRQALLQLIRPGFARKSEQGAIALRIPAEEIEAGRETLLNGLKQAIVEPILGANALAANPGTACQQCSFAGVCDASRRYLEGEETSGEEPT